MCSEKIVETFASTTVHCVMSDDVMDTSLVYHRAIERHPEVRLFR